MPTLLDLEREFIENLELSCFSCMKQRRVRFFFLIRKSFEFNTFR